jgi:lambda family phage portal protein
MSRRDQKVVKIANSYDGASATKRAQTWNDSDIGPNSGISSKLAKLRSRSRSLYRNDGWIRKGLNAQVTNEVGKGITARSGDAELDDYWRNATRNCDPEGQLTFEAMQALIVLERRTSGEVFIRRRLRRNAGAKARVQLQIIESDYVDESYSKVLANGNIIRSGVEFNKRGERVAYHVYTEHPQEAVGYQSSKQKIRVLARDMIHHFLPIRAGQVRGEPDPAPAIVKAYTLRKYTDTELQRKELRSVYTGSIEKDAILGDGDDAATDPDESLTVQGGSFIELGIGEKINLFDGDVTGSGYAEFMKMQLLEEAASLDLPYELLTGDWAGVNDRLVRAILNEYRRKVEMAQQHLMIPQVCQRVFEWVVDAGVLFGDLPSEGYADNRRKVVSPAWTADVWPYIHPEQDVNTRIKEIDGRLKSRTQSISERNGDIDQVDKERSEEQQSEEALGINELTKPSTEKAK